MTTLRTGILLAALSLSFNHLTQDSSVLAPNEKQQIATALENDAEIMSNTQLKEQIAGQPPKVEAEVLDINTHARNRSLQFALLIPLIAALLGLGASFRMIRLPDLKPSANVEEAGLG